MRLERKNKDSQPIHHISSCASSGVIEAGGEIHTGALGLKALNVFEDILGNSWEAEGFL